LVSVAIFRNGEGLVETYTDISEGGGFVTVVICSRSIAIKDVRNGQLTPEIQNSATQRKGSGVEAMISFFYFADRPLTRSARIQCSL